jgi:hypothetical protein
MLEYLDTTDTDTDFIPESDNDRSEQDAYMPHPQLLTLCLTVKMMT